MVSVGKPPQPAVTGGELRSTPATPLAQASAVGFQVTRVETNALV
jgi:hypothetical protein